MPIHFQCSSCQRRLKVGSHKAGSSARCPSCNAVVRVPTQQDLEAAEAMAGGPPPHSDPTDFSDFVFEDTPAAADHPVAAPPAAGELIDPDLVSISRPLLYVQGVLIAAVALVAFIVGYLIGGAGTAGPSDNQPPAGPLAIEGRLEYTTPSGDARPDAGAVLVMLPHGTSPDEKIDIDGLSPADPPPAADHGPLRALESLGGAYRRADAEGRFVLELPQPGKYHVLLLSHSARRPGGAPPRPEDLAVLGRFFRLAPDLLGDRDYTMQAVQIDEDKSIEHTFQRNPG